MKKIINVFAMVSALLLSANLMALEPLSGDELGNITAQGGVYLSGDLTINDNGGPLNVDGPDYWQTSCSSVSTDSRCGARLALNSGDEGGGWFVLDNIRGRFSFEGLTLRTRRINNGFNGDGAGFDQDVLELGLPNRIEFEELKFTVANSNAARPTASGFQQSNIFTVNVNGYSNQQGNLLIFPTGTP